MADKVDVLAVMDDLRGVMYGPLIDGKPGTDSPLDAQAVEARASVAELIAAAEEAALNAYATDLEQSKSRARLRAALAACRGVA